VNLPVILGCVSPPRRASWRGGEAPHNRFK